MDYLYHFLMAPVLRKNNVDPESHYKRVKEHGSLLCHNSRVGIPKGMMLRRDPEADSNYVFLTGNRDLLSNGIQVMKNSPKNADKISNDLRIFGFIFNAESFRYQPGVLWRSGDIIGNPDCLTVLYERQEITFSSEIMVPYHVDLSLAVGMIWNNEEIFNDVGLEATAIQYPIVANSI